jgi:VIT1/CCC1 family predicted Fe2+/Mn2+ transporter
LGSAKLVVIGGLAELFSGAISMGLGAYLAAVTERDHYISEEKREREEVENTPEEEKEEIYEIMHGYGVNRDETKSLVDALASNPEQWVRVRLPYCISSMT